MRHPSEIPALLSCLAAAAVAATMFAGAGSALAQTAPKIVKKVPPEFPAEAVRRGIDRGVLKAKLTIDDKGVPTEVTIIEAQPPKARILGETLVESLKTWRWEGQGKPHTFELQVVFADE